MTPSARGYMLEAKTVHRLNEAGYRAERVARSGRRNGGDLFGCVDVVAVSCQGVEMIQVTTKTNASARRRKIRDANLPWPVRLFLWFKVKNRWVCTSEVVEPVPLPILFDDYERASA